MDLQHLNEITKISYTTIYSYVGQRVETILVSTHNNILSGASEFKKSLSTTEKVDLAGKKVYFLKNVTFSRKKFLEKNPGVKLSRIENADVIVIDKDKINIPYQGIIKLDVGSDGKYYYPGYSSGVQILHSKSFISIGSPYTHERDEESIRVLKDLIKYRKEKELVDVSSLSLPSEVEFSIDIFEKVCNMLSSKDVDLYKIALNILSELDVDKDTEKFKLIFTLFERNIRNVQWNVEAKTLIQRLATKGVHLTTMNYQFWISLGADHPDDEFYTSALNWWLKLNGATIPYKVKIVKA